MDATPPPDRKLRVINGAALTEAIADLQSQLGDEHQGSAFALIAILWPSLPPAVVDGLVHLAAGKVGVVGESEVFGAYASVS